MGLTARIRAALEIALTSAQDLGTARYDHTANWDKDLTDGSGLNQANKVFQDSVTLAGSGAQTYDLDGTLTGPLGTVTFSRILAILIRRTDTPAASTQDEDVKIHGDFVLTKLIAAGGDTLSGMWIPIRPGGVFVYVAPDATGVAITASTGDQLTLTNVSAADSVTLEVVIIGS